MPVRRGKQALWDRSDDPVDARSIREAREDLADLVRDNPELSGAEAQARLEKWVAQEDAMVKTGVPMSIRLDADTNERLTAIIKKHSPPGLSLTKTDAVRMALAVGLDALERKK